MKLTSLEIYGFKSFADKTKFVFDQGITGIVGPNGCGKSNVIDSIRWVLGEQKMRNLRSEKMENIIFNGTDKRKKSNFVEVAITFENTKNLLPTAFTTVTVTRRLYRDGDSEYLLNNVPCRLKDINSLFLDTGIGSDSYAIIELGMIDSILNDKNNSRRLLFEEAAGVSRYKIRKKETFLRLEETDKSLERLDDVIFEVEKNLKSYEKQAKRAEQYFELKAEYRLYSIRFAYLKTQDILQVIAQLQTEVEDLNQKMIFADTRIAKHDARVAELQLDATNFEKLLSDKQKILNTHIDTIRKIENEKALRHERIKNLHSRKSTFEKQIITGKERITELQQQMERLEPQIDEANENYDKIEFYLTELEQEQEELKKAVQNRKLQVDEASQQLRSKENTLNHLTRENDRRNTLLGSLDSEKERIRKDLHQRQAEADNFAQTIEKISQEIILLEQECKSIQADKDLVELQVATLTEEATATNEQIFKTRGQLDAKKHEYNLLKDLVENLEGYPESVKFLKQKLKWTKKTSLISDIFYCGQDYKVAIENYLEPYMNYYVVDTQEEALEAIGLLQAAGKGRANFFVLQELNQAYPEKQLYVNSQNTNIVPALDIVEYDAYYTPLANYLFASVYIVEGHDAKVPESATAWVHKNGAVIARKFMLSGGSLGLFEGKRIGRARNLEILQNEITTLETQLKQEQSTLLKLKDELESLKKQKNNRALEDALQRLQRKKDERTTHQARYTEHENARKRLEKRTNEIEQEMASLNKELARHQPGIEALQNEINDLYRQLSVHQREYNNRSEAFTIVNAKYNQENIRFLDTKNRIASLKKDFRNALEQVRLIEKNEAELADEILNITYQIQTQETETGVGEDELITLYEQKRSYEAELTEIEQKVQYARSAVQQNEGFIRNERKQKENLFSKQTEIKDKINQLNIKLNSVNERIGVEWQIDITALEAHEFFEQPFHTYKLSEVENQLNRLREKYVKFGEVNPTALETYKEIKERYDTLIAQRDDILTAKKDLLATMEEIDTTAREKFMESFNAIRDNFIRVFRTLFTENDTCDLVLQNPGDPLESPIEIIARPKGKRPLTINQLSGGEKTLTATSLLFSIYLLKPAPFCIFDEVDAPLDDANIDKFNNIIKEFSNQSQFIIVTHNKRTMTHTNILYGVTMEEMGISRVLPVDLTQLNL